MIILYYWLIGVPIIIFRFTLFTQAKKDEFRQELHWISECEAVDINIIIAIMAIVAPLLWPGTIYKLIFGGNNNA